MYLDVEQSAQQTHSSLMVLQLGQMDEGRSEAATAIAEAGGGTAVDATRVHRGRLLQDKEGLQAVVEARTEARFT